MCWFALAAVVVSAAAQAKSSSDQAKNATAGNQNSAAWAEYNTEMQYQVDQDNIRAQKAITDLNARSTMLSAEVANASNQAIVDTNVSLIQATSDLNNTLFEADLADMWSQAGLDMQLIGMQRARERGTMEAQMGASGTTMGVGSNADVVIDQRTQEAMDLFISKTGANVKAQGINNAMVKSKYMADQEIKKLTYEGRIRNMNTSLNASLQSSTMVAENEIKSIAGMSSAEIRTTNEGLNNEATTAQNQSRIDSNLAAGMMGAATTLVAGSANAAAGGMGGSTSGTGVAYSSSSVSSGFGSRTSIAGGMGGV